MLQLPIYYSLDWWKCGNWKNKAREIVFVERWMQWLLLWLKSQRTREASRHSAFMDICQTISHPFKSHLPSRWVLVFVPVVAERNKEAGWTWGFIFLFLVLIRWNEKGRWVQDVLLSPQGFDSFHLHLPRARWRDLMCVCVCVCV